MSAKELIELLKKLPPEKEVMIEQGGEHDYQAVHGVKEIQVWDAHADEENEDVDIIAIQFS